MCDCCTQNKKAVDLKVREAAHHREEEPIVVAQVDKDQGTTRSECDCNCGGSGCTCGCSCC